ncbi:hypothetical protein SUGI_1488530 [Cryptomeria japonica]|uniref:T20D4.11-like domain-containing protein n=1 Tax=Cryptomeria japonica TaxID=3369 RepID=A0AAD3NSR7_CRYJA|nr:uncharacterized protein LOC131872595 [Cryptomeria japonica]GLJ59016.1 hypothetical protein SUGI_1488530 [Cryptomeria japonica]
MREFDLCAATLLVFTQSPGGLATSEQDINKQCVHLKDTDSCLRNYTRRCMTPMQRGVVTMTANASFQMLNEYCTPRSHLRTNYLKHASCLNQVQKKEQKSCTRDLQASLEMLGGSGGGADGGSVAVGKRLQLMCCTYKRFESCLAGQLDKRCGKEAVSFVNGLLRRATSRLPETMCRNYKPDSGECKALLPRTGTIPKGAKSTSILSRLLSAYTGL